MFINNELFKVEEVSDRQYYVYVYYDDNKIPFYIGKGTGDRMEIHLRNRKYTYFKNIYFYKKLNKIIKNKESFSFKKIKENLSEKEAFIIEEILINAIGRKFNNTGTLYNTATGGGSCGISDIHYKNVALYEEDTFKLFKTFTSVIECASFLKVHPANVSCYSKKKIPLGKIDKKYFIDYFTETPNDTFIPKLVKDLRKEKNHFNYLRNKITCLNIKTNEVITFESVKDTVKYFKLCSKTIKRCYINNTVYKGEWKFIYDK